MELDNIRFLSDKTGAKEHTPIPIAPTAQYCFKTSRTNTKPSSILFEFSGGTIIKSFSYINLSSKHYDRNIGILLFYTNATVTIYGSHLDTLFLALHDHKVTSINEYNQKPQANDEVTNMQQAIVQRIEVAYKDAAVDKDIEAFENKDFTQYDEVG